MKKSLSIILALSMTVALLCNPAMAERVGKDTPDTTSTMDVTINLDPGDLTHKYYIDIEFGALEFTFAEGDKTWDPEKYDYNKTSSDGGWSGDGRIKIVNHSDERVKYVISPQNVVDTYGELAVTVDGSTSTTGTIDGCTPGIADGSMNASATVGVSGTPDSSLTATSVKLGEVQVVISKP